MNKKIVKYSNLEIISVLILLALLPLVITNIYCLIGFIVNKEFNYPLYIVLVELVIALCFIIISLIVHFNSKIIEIYNDRFIFEQEIIYFKNIKNVSYIKMNILLLPIMYIYKNGNGLIFTINYVDDDNTNKKVYIRLPYKKILIIEESLKNIVDIEYN